MLKRLFVKNFTVFAEANFEFGPGLNVVVGTNGTGKSQVLKLGYAVLRSLTSRLKDGVSMDSPLSSLEKIFRPVPAEVSELVRRGTGSPAALIQYELDDERITPGQLILSPDISTEASFNITPSTASKEISSANSAPVFIPAKEVLTLGWMLPASEQLELPLDETYLDLLRQLGRLPLKNPKEADVLAQLSKVVGGKVEAEGGRFYLSFPKEKQMDMHLVAEGLRKFGTLQRLLSNGSLTSKSTLFWDEPEANLNPALLRKLAAVLAVLAWQGFQIILATHSLFLLKELHIISQQKDARKLPVRYFGLNAGKEDGATVVTTVDDFDELPDIVALDEELEQSGKFLDVLNGTE